MLKNGKFITFEGIDGSGKSTVVKAVVEELKRRKKTVIAFQEPGTTPMGLEIRKAVKSDVARSSLSELLMYEASRADLVEQVLKPVLPDFDFVLCDRYIHSTIAYQGYGNGTSIQMIRQLNEIATKGLTPTKSFLIDVDLQIAEQRRGDRFEDNVDIFDKDISFAECVYRGYQELVKDGELVRVNNNRPLDIVVNEIVDQMLEA